MSRLPFVAVLRLVRRTIHEKPPGRWAEELGRANVWPFEVDHSDDSEIFPTSDNQIRQIGVILDNLELGRVVITMNEARYQRLQDFEGPELGHRIISAIYRVRLAGELL